MKVVIDARGGIANTCRNKSDLQTATHVMVLARLFDFTMLTFVCWVRGIQLAVKESERARKEQVAEMVASVRFTAYQK